MSKQTRLMVNENEALEAVADKVDDDTDPIPKDESAIVINWRHGTLPMLTIVLEDGTQRVTRRALRPGEKRHNNHFIAPPGAPYAGKDTPDAPYAEQTSPWSRLNPTQMSVNARKKSTNNYYQRKEEK